MQVLRGMKHDGRRYDIGDRIDVSPEIAAQLIARGLVKADQKIMRVESLDEAPVPGQDQDPDPEPEPLRMDGPTIEEWVTSGYRPEHYPPDGWAEMASPGLVEYRALSPELQAVWAPLDEDDGEVTPKEPQTPSARRLKKKKTK